MGAWAIFKPLPEIPDALRLRSIDLVAIARFKVAADGSAQVELIEPTTDPELNHALLDSLKCWRFFPAMLNGKPVVQPETWHGRVGTRRPWSSAQMGGNHAMSQGCSGTPS
jgi:outer membrane biosynthesis protein TonB